MKKKIISILLSVSVSLGTTAVFAESKLDTEYIEAMSDFIDQNYLYNVDKGMLTEGALKGLFYNLDPYSSYYTETEYKQLTEELDKNEKSAGIGIKLIEVEHNFKIIEVLKGHSAESAGLRVGDIVVSIDGKSVEGLALESVSNLVKGAANTSVRVGVLREDSEDELFFDVMRTPITYHSVESSVIDGVGYVKINEFSKGSFKKIEKGLNDLKSQNISRVIFDVRDNPGGYLTDVVNTLGLIAPEGPIMYVKDKSGREEKFYSFNKENTLKTVVLTNKNSASAAEVFAGALKDRGVSTIIGTKSFGKGTVQDIIPLTRGGAVKITVAEYFTPSKAKVNGVGIVPHIQVEDKIDETGKDLVLTRALDEIKK